MVKTRVGPGQGHAPACSTPESDSTFTALGERLARRGVVADLFVVVGGAAMALAYDANRGHP
jgi:hypothetical protein